MDWIHLTKDRIQRWTIPSSFIKNCEFLTRWTIVRFKRTLLQSVSYYLVLKKHESKEIKGRPCPSTCPIHPSVHPSTHPQPTKEATEEYVNIRGVVSATYPPQCMKVTRCNSLRTKTRVAMDCLVLWQPVTWWICGQYSCFISSIQHVKVQAACTAVQNAALQHAHLMTELMQIYTKKKMTDAVHIMFNITISW